MRHGLQGWQSESFVKRRKHKNLGGVVEDPQHFDGDEAEEAHVVLDAAADNSAPQVRVLGNFVADDDQFEAGILALFFQLSFERGKCLNDSYHILVRADAPRIKQERIIHLVALGEKLDRKSTRLNSSHT